MRFMSSVPRLSDLFFFEDSLQRLDWRGVRGVTQEDRVRLLGLEN